MKKDDFLIKVSEDADVDALVHIRNIGPTDHVTMCGLDGHDPSLGQGILKLKRGDKMNCPTCNEFYVNRRGLNINKQWLEI